MHGMTAVMDCPTDSPRIVRLTLEIGPLASLRCLQDHISFYSSGIYRLLHRRSMMLHYNETLSYPRFSEDRIPCYSSWNLWIINLKFHQVATYVWQPSLEVA